MRSRLRNALLASAFLLAVVAVGLGLAGGTGTPRRAGPAPPPPAASLPPAVASPAATPIDPDRIRDVFRFGDEEGAARREVVRAAPRRREAAPAPPPSPAGPRLVGVVRRGGRLLAALAGADGQVELAGAGEPAAGVTVLTVSEDSVRIRRGDGSETTLSLPE